MKIELPKAWEISNCYIALWGEIQKYQESNFFFILQFKTQYIWFGLVMFYGISTLVDYSMPDPVYTYMICKWIVYKKDFLKQNKTHLHTNGFKNLTLTILFIINHFFCTHLKSFKYCYLTPVVLFAHSEMVSSIAI